MVARRLAQWKAYVRVVPIVHQLRDLDERCAEAEVGRSEAEQRVLELEHGLEGAEREAEYRDRNRPFLERRLKARLGSLHEPHEAV